MSSTRWLCALLLAAAVIVVLPRTSWADEPKTAVTELEQVFIETADTPKEHEALARYFHAKAQRHRRVAAEHRAMAKSYGAHKQALRGRQRAHCDRLVALNEEIAAEFESLAKGHEEEARD